MKYATGLLLALLMVGCAAHNDGQDNAAKARQMFEAFNRHDWNAMAAFYAEPAMFLDPSFGTEYVQQTRKQTAEKYSSMQQMFPDLHDEIAGVYPSGDKVTVEFVSTGTAPDSSTFRLPIITVLTFDNNGLIVRDATYYDNP
jgi:ketosteroid isomerase-like protein